MFFIYTCNPSTLRPWTCNLCKNPYFNHVAVKVNEHCLPLSFVLDLAEPMTPMIYNMKRKHSV